jgi:DeoR/GlpR family transcriptional regulator of sugar metabolism
MLFLGVHGMSTHAGFTTPNLMEAETDRALVQAARRLVVVADHTKWELVGISTIAQLHDAQILITDSGLAGSARDQLASEVGELLIAE